MQTAVIVFPGSNCDRDLAVAFEKMSGKEPHLVWHKDKVLPKGIDLIGLPGGFSFGDYLRCGAIAAKSPIMNEVVKFANAGGPVLGICNGFQVLIEAGLLPGALMRNAGLKFVCKTAALKVETTKSVFTERYRAGQTAYIPIAHHDGNYCADERLLDQLRAEDRIAFTYHDNPNGSTGDIAGILSSNRRILGMMPHPERAIDPALGGADGAMLFAGLVDGLIPA